MRSFYQGNYNLKKGITIYLLIFILALLIFFPENQLAKSILEIVNKIKLIPASIIQNDYFGIIRFALVCLTIVAIFKILSTKA